MSNVKDNHFVPRFYLRNFTIDPAVKNGRFDFFNLKSRKYIGKIPYGSQMKEKYFYEKDSEIEQMLGEKFEGKHATLVRDLREDITKPNESMLLEMVLLMHFRTRAQRDEDLTFRKHMINTLLDSLVESFKAHLRKDAPWLLDRVTHDEVKDLVRSGSSERYLRKTDTTRKEVRHFLKIKEQISGLRCAVLNNPTLT